jgi:hypothetical protein
LRLLALLLLRPRGEVFGHLVGAALDEHAPGLLAVVVVRRGQLVEQVGVLELREVGDLPRLRTLPRHAPDAAVRLVAARVAEIHLTVLDDRVAPVGDVERAVGAHLHVDRPEGIRGGAEHVGHFLGHVAGALVARLETHDAMRAEVARDHVALPVRREHCAAQNLDAGELGIVPRANAAENTPRIRIGDVARTGQAPVDAGAARAIGEERLPVVIEVMAPRIHPALEQNAHALVARIEAEHAAALQPHHAMRRLGVRARVDGLVHVKPPVEAPAERV